MTIGLELYLRIITVIAFTTVAAVSLTHFWRMRDEQHFYFALLCNTIAVSILLSEITIIDGRTSLLEGQIISLCVLLHPYLLFRIAHKARPLPVRWLRLLEIGLVISVLLMITDDIISSGFNLKILFCMGYFVVAQGGATYVFLREIRATRGVSRHRYLYTFVGTVLLIGVILILMIRIFFVPLFNFTSSTIPLLTALSGGAYMIGLAPPRNLRRSWQASLIIHYQNGIIGKLINKPADRILPFLARWSLRAIGGQNAILISYDVESNRISMNSLTETIKFTLPIEEMDGFDELLEKFEPEPRYVRRRAVPDDSSLAVIMDGFGAGAMFSVPVINLPHALTLLIITLRNGTLFVDEDMEILRRFAQHARAVMQNNSLIAVTQDLVEELRDETGDLEEMLMAREVALRASEDELRRRLVQTSALYKELEGFSYSVSHDLRAPLRAITGFSNALAEDYGAGLPPEAREYIQRITNNSHKMQDLMNDMLKLSKLSRSEVAFANIDLTDIAVRVGHELRALYPSHHISFTVEPAMFAYADPVLAKILLTNLLGNAWKFTIGTPKPAVLFNTIRNDGEIIYAISDNGAGFDADYVEKLFKPFQRLHTIEAFEGNGIGLAIVQRIVNRHGGRVWAEGQIGKGTQFYFTLPGRVT